jgi:hypothetical protein
LLAVHRAIILLLPFTHYNSYRAILHKLSEQYKINFSYGHHQAALDKKLSIGVEEISLHQLLSALLGEAGLTFKVVGKYVVLRKVQGQYLNRADTSNFVVMKGSRGPEPEKDSLPKHAPEIIETRKPDTLAKVNRYGPAAVVPSVRSFKIRPVPVAEHASHILRESASPFTTGPVFSFDLMNLKLKSAYGANQELSSDLNFSVGWIGRWEVYDWLIAETQLLYRVKGFTVLYLLEKGEEPLGIPKKTEVNLIYAEVPLGAQVRLLQYKRIALNGALGFFCSYLLGQQEKMWLDDGRLFNTTAMYNHSLSTFLWGGRTAFCFTYSQNDK